MTERHHPYHEPPESTASLLGLALVGLMIGMLGGCGLALAIGVVYALFMISLEIHISVCIIYSICVLLGGYLGVKNFA